jgi:hypothetical protein
MVTKKMPAKLMASPGRIASSPPPASSARNPPAAVIGTAGALSSSPERMSASCGGTVAASQAGSAAETRVASMPNTAPLRRLAGSMAMPRTVTTK